MDHFVCYCFGYTESDIREDCIANGGRSLILEKIMASKKTGACRCAENHPLGR